MGEEGKRGVNDSYDKMFGSNFELCWSKSKHKRALARVLWKGIFGMSEEFDKSRHHPTQKPVKLSIWFLDKFSKNNQNVADVYGGSGSTLIACEELQRNCFMMELNPEYCQVIIDR
jgi:DNA modification methylase